MTSTMPLSPIMSPRGLLLAASTALAACTPASTSPAPSTTVETTARAAASAAPPSPAPVAAASPDAGAAVGTVGEDSLVGQPAPDFTATAQNGTVVHLAALKGKPVVLYFYPKDETPGCTKEACSFRDAWQALAKTGAVLVGISADTLDSHRGFAEHWKLPFLLVSDPDGAIAQRYGVPFNGVHKRQTIVVGPDGNVRKVFRSVNVGVHAQEVLAELGRTS